MHHAVLDLPERLLQFVMYILCDLVRIFQEKIAVHRNLYIHIDAAGRTYAV